MITFKVSDVVINENPISKIDYLDHMAAVAPGSLEATELVSPDLVEVSASHPLIGALNLAHDQHYPVSLSPDMVFLCCTQGLATHVNQSYLTSRDRFVKHEGKLSLDIFRDSFIRGSKDNDWKGCFSEFSEKIRDHLNDGVHDMLVADFSTTGVVERAASEIVLMDVVKNYFKYTVWTRCGIPEITLEGSVDDWVSVRSKVEEFYYYGEDLDWWLDKLLPVIDSFVAAASGDVDRFFWQSFFKINDGSGGPFINGHVNALFPYLIPGGNSVYKNPFSKNVQGITTDAFFSGLSSVPFTWDYYGTPLPMRFLAGFVGVTHSENVLRPHISWAVSESEDSSISRSQVND